MTPLISDPLATLEDDYHQAVVYLVWNVHRSKKIRTLLCGTVELLPREVPPPLEIPERSTKLSNEHILYATARVVTAREGLSWFEAAARGHVVRPHRDGSLAPVAHDAPTFAAVAFDEDPPAPHLVTSSRRIPFSADWHDTPRVRHLLARDFSPSNIWSTQEFEIARKWASAEMHFDWTLFPEYWGSIHLIAPNPVFRALNGRLVRSGCALEFVVAFELRAGKTFESLEYQLESRHATGTSFIIRRQVTNTIEHIALPCTPEQMHERVYDLRRGLLYTSGPFITEITFSATLNLSSEIRHVSVSRLDGTVEQYETPLIGGFSTGFRVGDTKVGRDGAARLWSAQKSHKARVRGNAEQKWFRDRVPDATEVLRSLIRNTSASILVVDPYFEGDDLLRIVLAVTNPSIPIDILAGAEHLRAWHNSEKRERHHSYLAKCLLEANAAGRMNPIKLRVMKGASPAIHDRFLLVDRALWMLGSSLNAFGSRGTLLLKVPDPDPIVHDLRTVWNESEEFPEWLANRHR